MGEVHTAVVKLEPLRQITLSPSPTAAAAADLLNKLCSTAAVSKAAAPLCRILQLCVVSVMFLAVRFIQPS